MKRGSHYHDLFGSSCPPASTSPCPALRGLVLRYRKSDTGMGRKELKHPSSQHIASQESSTKSELFLFKCVSQQEYMKKHTTSFIDKRSSSVFSFNNPRQGVTVWGRCSDLRCKYFIFRCKPTSGFPDSDSTPKVLCYKKTPI